MRALGEHYGAVWRGSTRDQTTLDPFVGGFFATFGTPHWQPLAHSKLLPDCRFACSVAVSDRPQGPLCTCSTPWVVVLKHFPMLPSGKMLGPQQIVGCHAERSAALQVPSYGPDGSPVVFSQQHGIPMGLSVCVIIANIFVGSIFAPVFRRAHLSGLVRVFLARGYVDDGIALIQGTVEAIRILVDLLGKAHPCIAITTVSSTTHAFFLDMVVSKGLEGSTLGKLGARAAGLQGAHQAW
jgi:hypothetical protein